MRRAVAKFWPPALLCRASPSKTTSFAFENATYVLDPCAEGASFRSTKLVPATAFCSNASDHPPDYYATPPQSTYPTSNLDAKMRMKAFRKRETMQLRYSAELQEAANKYDLDPAKILHKGDPDTVQGIIKEVIPDGYIITLPNGKEGFLPSRELGTTGGVSLLERLFPVGQEITVREVRVGGYGRMVVAIKKDTIVDLPDRPYKGHMYSKGSLGRKFQFILADKENMKVGNGASESSPGPGHLQKET